MRRLLVLVAATRIAHADESPFVTLDRSDQTTRIGLESSLSTTTYASDPTSRNTVVRAELHGQYVHATGFGGYAKLPLSYANHQYDEQDPGESSLRTHNFEVGGLYARPLTRSLGVAAQVGLVLPTLNDDSLFEYRLAFDGSRAADALLSSASKVTALRLSASPMFRAGGFLARADVGLDFVRSSKETETGRRLSTVMARFGLGAGYSGRNRVVMAELATYDPTSERPLYTLAVSGRFTVRSVQPYAALVFPIDDREVGSAITVGLGFCP